ncbi:MAG: hypothetical protein ACOX4K_02535 [Bacillota bacterium]
MRKQIINLIGFLCGLLMLLDYYFKAPLFKTMAQEIRSWAVVISAFAIGLGGVNLVLVHSSSIRKKQQPFFSGVLLIGLAVTIIVGLSLGIDSNPYVFLFDNIVVACGTTMYSMLAFYLGSASYRAFRARNAEAALLLLAAILVMMGRVPIGKIISPYLPVVSEWIMNIPNTAGQRGIMICSALGYLSISLRMLLGLERGYGVE